MGRKRVNNPEAKVHKDLQGLDLKINAFGEIVWNKSIDEVKEFLDKNVPDKKLIFRNDKNLQEGDFGPESLGTYVPDEEVPFELAESKPDESLDFDEFMSLDVDKTVEEPPIKKTKKIKE
jgi:hypothetical protein